MWPFSKPKKEQPFVPSCSLKAAVKCSSIAETRKVECDKEIEELIKKEHPEYAAYCRLLDDIHDRQISSTYFGKEAQTSFESFWNPVRDYIQNMKNEYREEILRDCLKEGS